MVNASKYDTNSFARRKYIQKPLSLSKLNSIDKGVKDTQISRILTVKTYYQK